MRAADARAKGPRCAAVGMTVAGETQGRAQGLWPFRCGEERGLAGETQERAQCLWPFRYGEERGAGGGPRRLKACGLSLCGWRHIFIPKSTGRRIRKRLPGRYFSV